jgi:hypothetical protein
MWTAYSTVKVDEYAGALWEHYIVPSVQLDLFRDVGDDLIHGAHFFEDTGP